MTIQYCVLISWTMIHTIIVKRVSAGEDHSPEVVEIEEHTPLKFQIYNTQHTHIAVSYGVMLIQVSTCVGCPMVHK